MKASRFACINSHIASLKILASLIFRVFSQFDRRSHNPRISGSSYDHTRQAFSLVVLLLIPLISGIQSAEATQVNVAPVYGAPYHTTDYYPPGSCSNSYVSDSSPYSIITQWWANYQPCWITGTGRICSYKVSVDPAFFQTGFWGGATLTGDCGGGSGIFGTATCPSGYLLSGNQCVGNGGPIGGKNKGPQCCKVGNPINAGIGNKVLAETDFTDAGVIPLPFTRTYNSIPDAQLGAMGGYWRHNYERQLISVSKTGISSLMAKRPDGRDLYFTASSGVWQADSDIADTVTTITGGWSYHVASDDSVETYNAQGKLTTITYRNGVVLSLTYSDGTTGANGGYILDANGSATTTTLPAGLLLRVTNSYGRTLGLGYDVFSRVIQLTDAAHQNYLYHYDSYSNIISVTYPDTKIRTYVYNESANTASTNLPNALTGIIDENNSRFATYKYDSSGRAISTEHAGGVEKTSITYTVDANGNITSSSVTDPLNTTRTYSFGNVLGVAKNSSISQSCSGCGGTASNATTYDANGNVASRTDFNGNKTTYVYDLARNLETSRTEGLTSAGASTPQTRTITTTWHATYRLPTLITESGKTTGFTYDTNGNRLTKTIADTALGTSRTWTYTYNALGQILTVNGPRTDVSDVTTYTYYASASTAVGSAHSIGDLATVTDALGHVTNITNYDLNGQPLSIADANGVVTTLTYWPRGWLHTSTVNGVQTTTYDYDSVGQLAKVTQPDASYLSYTYDNAHRLTDITDNAGNKIHYTLDAMGNRTQEDTKDPSNAITKTRSRIFDALNRLQKDIGGTSPTTQITQYGYDSNSNLKTITDPLTHVTTNGYDALNRLITITDPNTPTNGVTTNTYNARNQLTSVSDPRLIATNYTIDALGNVSLTQSPDSGNTTKVFDAAGNLTQKTDARSIVANYTYDALNRLASITYPAHTAENASFTYDSTSSGNKGIGRLTGYSNDGGATAILYDAYGNVTQQTAMIGSQFYVTGYQYDSVNRLQQITYPSGRLVIYTRNSLGQITQVQTKVNSSGSLQSIVSSVGYEPFGPIKNIAFGNGVTTTTLHDADYRISRITATSIPTWDFNYGYDAASNILSITDQHTPATYSKSYTYDNLNRVITDTSPSGNLGYQYDAGGNRTQFQIVPFLTLPQTYASTSNRETAAFGYAITQDAAGNTITTSGTSGPALAAQYNNANRMSQSTFLGGNLTTYLYDALDQRTVMQATLPTHYAYLVDGKYLAQLQLNTNGTYNQGTEYIWLDNVPVAQIQNVYGASNAITSTKLTYIHADHLNTPRALTNTAKAIVWRSDEDAYGESGPNEDPGSTGTQTTLDLRFPGQIASGVAIYNMNRDYDPGVGRYLQPDPVGLRGGLNPYAYVGNDPVNYFDPDGLDRVGADRGPVERNGRDTSKPVERKGRGDNDGDGSGGGDSGASGSMPPLPSKDRCSPSEFAGCEQRCGKGLTLACYVSQRWQVSKWTPKGSIRKPIRLVECDCFVECE